MIWKKFSPLPSKWKSCFHSSATKFQEILQSQAVNIWLLLPNENVELMHQAGEDPDHLSRVKS